MREVGRLGPGRPALTYLLMSEAYRSTGSYPWRTRRNRTWPVYLVIAIACLSTSFLLMSMDTLTAIGAVAAIGIFITTFVSTQAGLYIIVFSMLLSPEIGVGSLGGSSEALARRGVTIRAEDLLLIVLGFAWITRAALYKQSLSRGSPLNRPILYYVAMCLFATIAGLMAGSVSGTTPLFYVLKYVEYFVLYFIVLNSIRSKKQIERITWAMLLTGLVVSVVAIAQIPGGGRVSAPFEGEHGEPNTLGGYLILTGAIAAGISLNMGKSWMRVALRLLIVTMFIPYVFTLSRGSYMALPFVYLTLLVYQKKSRVAMIILAAVVVGIVSAAVPKAVRDRISGTFKDSEYQAYYGTASLGGVAVDASVSARIDNWTGAVERAMESPIWGLGVTGYGFVDAQYPRILVEVGLLGVASFVFLISAVFREANKVIRAPPDDFFRGLAVGVIAGTVGLLVHAIGANTFTIVRIMEPFWLSVGLVAAVSTLGIGDAGEALESGPGNADAGEVKSQTLGMPMPERRRSQGE